MSEAAVVPNLAPGAVLKVNKIGDRTAPRPKEQTMDVWSPEGVKETHLRFNARDLINIHGWTDYDPAAVKVKTAEDSADEADEQAGVVQDIEAVTELAQLRAKLTELGGEVDNRWGKNRLTEEITKREKSA